jgi:hypothetical protein
MKPCSRYKKQIALLAAKSLAGKEAGQVRDHLHQCERCREYWNDVSLLCGGHFDLAATLPTVETDGRFHQRLVDRINANEGAQKSPPWVAAIFLETVTLCRRKIVFASSAALAVAGLLAFLASRPKAGNPVVNSAPPPVSPVVAKKATPQPTFMAYRMAASRSFEELDALLVKDADRLLPAVPLVRASMRWGIDSED